MTQADLILHWQGGAHDAMEVAKFCHETKRYDLALFHCHLAVEKMLKATYISEYDHDHPFTHDLLQLGLSLKRQWSEEEKMLLAELTDYATSARYSDPAWAQKQATEEASSAWIIRTESFLSSFQL
jgi:HEPN domain-containing protein